MIVRVRLSIFSSSFCYRFSLPNIRSTLTGSLHIGGAAAAASTADAHNFVGIPLHLPERTHRHGHKHIIIQWKECELTVRCMCVSRTDHDEREAPPPSKQKIWVPGSKHTHTRKHTQHPSFWWGVKPRAKSCRIKSNFIFVDVAQTHERNNNNKSIHQ